MTSTGNGLYSVLLTYPNPTYNRLAVYTPRLSALLIDKSLNGYIADEIIDAGGREYLKVIEDYRTKDLLRLNRMSLYAIEDTAVHLAFRDFIRLVEPKIVYDQVIIEFTGPMIKTSFSSSQKSDISGKGDIFTYDSGQRKYISTNRVFYNFVLSEIQSFNHKAENPEINDYSSMVLSTGMNPILDSLKSSQTSPNPMGFTLSLDKNWKEMKNFTVVDHIKKSVKGYHYVNEVIGADLSVIMIPPNDKIDKYIDYKLNNTLKTKYTIMYSNKIDLGRNFVQYFEYFCASKKYLLIITASKYTYDNYKKIFDNIVYSFIIKDC